MATKKVATQPTTAEIVETPTVDPVELDIEATKGEIAAKKAYLRTLEGKPATVRVAKTKSLDDIISSQDKRIDTGIIRHFTARVTARVTAGQPVEDALTQAFAQYMQLVRTALTNKA